MMIATKDDTSSLALCYVEFHQIECQYLVLDGGIANLDPYAK